MRPNVTRRGGPYDGRVKSAQGVHRPADERRAQLLDAALEVLREHGLAGLTTRAVTARAGVPHGIFHYAFGSKAALVRALVERELTGAVAAWDVAVATDDLETALRQAFLAQLDIVRADPEHQRLVAELIRAARDDSDLPAAACRTATAGYADAAVRSARSFL